MVKKPEYPTVEFSNNGLIDRLSGAPAQHIFTKSLRQAVANAERSKSDISLLTMKVINGAEQKLSTTEELEKTLVGLSKVIRKSLRGEDFYTRMSERGYWILIHGDKLAGMKVLERLQAGGSFNLETQIHMREESTSAQSWMSEVDRSYFK